MRQAGDAEKEAIPPPTHQFLVRRIVTKPILSPGLAAYNSFHQSAARQILEVIMALHKSLNPILEFPAKPEADYEAEVAEWLEAFEQVVDEEGANKGA